MLYAGRALTTRSNDRAKARSLAQALQGRMKRLLNIYNSASMVATLWLLSPLLPFAMLMRDESVQWFPWAGGVLLLAFGVSITKFRKQKKENNEWHYSDVIAYMVVPGTLFIVFSFVAINSV